MSYFQNPLNRPTQKRVNAIDSHTPYQQLQQALAHQDKSDTTTGVAYWFRKDLRLEDNTALYHAAEKAAHTKTPLITLYVYCPNALIWHGIAPARMHFILESLRDLQNQLHPLNIPLVIISVDQFSETRLALHDLFKSHAISDLYANYEYEVDELQRDCELVQSNHFNCFYYHDQCIVEPGKLVNKQNKPLQVFTHYHRSWVNHIHHNPHLTKTLPTPQKQSRALQDKLGDLSDSTIPKAPQEKRLQDEKMLDGLHRLWPAGHQHALKKLDYFIQHHLKDYAVTRNQPARDASSRMSPYLAIGAISPRTLLEKIFRQNKSPGVAAWVRELVFREFYRHRLLVTPHLSMNVPQHHKFSFVAWEEDEQGWEKWVTGKTGVPWIDAGMRQLHQEAYMHNRLRMSVACYLYSVLLIDYRRGERYFAETLIDYDLANNVQGWSPSYTLFNPILQSEKNDPNGDYIRQWVPELRAVSGKAIFDPYHRLSSAEFKKLGYPQPYMDWKASKSRSRARFKAAMRDH